MRIGEMAWTDVAEVIKRGAAAIIPVGSTEEHGPHAPMGDYMVVDEIARLTGDETGDLVVPTLPFGYSEIFKSYPGTITLRPEVLSGVLEDVIDCLLRHGLERVVIFNGHAGNMPIIELMTRRIRHARGILIPTISPLQIMQVPSLVREVYGDGVMLGHGGEPIGSLMLALKPDKVHMERAGHYGRQAFFGLPTDGVGAIVFEGIRVALPLDMNDIAPETGSLGDPKPASTDKGRTLIGYAVNRCVAFMQWFRSVNPKHNSHPQAP